MLVCIFDGAWVWDRTQPGQYDAFARCVADSGATFYGAFWCPSCKEQRAVFGRSHQHLPYVECSLPSGQGQNKTCDDAGITEYPTWDFGDGERVTGFQSIEILSEKTRCALVPL